MTNRTRQRCDRRKNPGHGYRRRGVGSTTAFTLVEMLAVILIIGILAALLLPVITGAYRNVREAQERSEVRLLEISLHQFQAEFGVYPPSQIVLIENGDYSPDNWRRLFEDNVIPDAIGADGEYLITRDAVFSRSLSVYYLRRIWPELMISETGPPPLDLDGDGNPRNSPLDFYDWNGDGNPPGAPTAFALSGDECLVFFLGGIPIGDYPGGLGLREPPSPTNPGKEAVPPGVQGFSVFPGDPTRLVNPADGTPYERVGPFFEFDTSRLIDGGAGTAPNGFWEYLPVRRDGNRGYAYFSAYEGAGYRPDDWNLADETREAFRVKWDMTDYPSAFQRLEGQVVLNVSPGPNPYTQGRPYHTGNQALLRHPLYWRGKSFQIISPGVDGLFGCGGAWSRTNGLPSACTLGESRAVEEDNLTNFADRSLGDL